MDEKQQIKTQALDPNTWLDEHGDYLYRYALSRLRDGNTAEEVVQDTFVGALKNINQFTGQSNERTWLLGIIKKKIIDVFRKRYRDPINMDEESSDISQMVFNKFGFWKKEVKAALNQSLNSLEREEFWAVLKKCLDLLPQRQADVFTLRSMEEHSAEDICKELNLSSTNYWVILHRARLQLSSCMKQKWFQEGSQ